MSKEERVVIPVVQEAIATSTRSVPVERVRVHKRVVESAAPVDLVSAREEVDVQRVPIGQYVESMPEVRVEGDTTIVPVVEEMVVVEKRLYLKEEVRIQKRRTVQARRVDIPIKREHVEIEFERSKEELERSKGS